MWAYETAVFVLVASFQPLNQITEFCEASHEHYSTGDRSFASFVFRIVCINSREFTRNCEVVVRKILFIWQQQRYVLIFVGSPKHCSFWKRLLCCGSIELSAYEYNALDCQLKRICSDRLYLFVFMYNIRTHYWHVFHEIKKDEEIICAHSSMSNAENLRQECQCGV